MLPLSDLPHKRRHLIQSALVFLSLTGLGHFAVDTERVRQEQNRRAQITQAALGLASRLEAELNANVFLANGMFTLITAVPNANETEKRAALKALFLHGRHVRNVGLAPGNRITDIYPREGNEAALGLYYPDMAKQWGAVKRAMDQRTTVVAGPVELRQGGNGLICRTPVYLENGHYWGMLSLVLDADALYRSAGLAREIDGVRFALRGRDGLGAVGDVFFGDPRIFSAGAVEIPLHVPGGGWVIAAQPAQGWHAGQETLAVLEVATVLAALIIAWVLYGYHRGRARTEASEQRLRAFMDTARDGVIVIDGRGIIHEFNHAAEALFGYGAEELLGTPLNRLMPSDDAQRHDQYIHQSSQTGVRAMGAGRQIVCKRRDGSTFPAEITVGHTGEGKDRVFVGVVRDSTQRKEFEQRLLNLANTDGLTGVLNRRAFMEEGRTLLQLARRHARPLSLLMLDADHFKKVNDSHGHHVGDRVLVRLAEIAHAQLRATDQLGRLGGEEFAILMPETGMEAAIVVAERLLDAIRAAEITTDAGDTLKFTVSIGIASLGPGALEIDDLLRQADAALYQAKNEGRDRWRGAATTA